MANSITVDEKNALLSYAVRSSDSWDTKLSDVIKVERLFELFNDTNSINWLKSEFKHIMIWYSRRECKGEVTVKFNGEIINNSSSGELICALIPLDEFLSDETVIDKKYVLEFNLNGYRTEHISILNKSPICSFSIHSDIRDPNSLSFDILTINSEYIFQLAN